MGASNIQENNAADDVLGSEVRVTCSRQTSFTFEEAVADNLQALSTKRRKVEHTAFIHDSQSEDDSDCQQSTLAVNLANDCSIALQHLIPHCSEVDLVDDRLSVLKHLIPHGLEFDEEEILNVAIDYVKSLERVIQRFSRSRQDVAAVEHSANQVTGVHAANGVLETMLIPEDDTLQKRGLCIVPLSILAKVF